MTMQYKKIAFLAPRPGMRDDAFRRYWREIHGPLVAGSPGYSAYRHRYVQNHVLTPGPVGDGFAFAGMAEFWLPGDNEDEFASTPIYRDRIRPDEMKFIDMEGTISMSALEQVPKPGGGPLKLVVLSGRAAGLSIENFRNQFASDFVETVLGETEFARRLCGWNVDHVVEASFRLPGARPVLALPIDSIQSFWFNSDEDMQAAFAHLKAARRVRTVSDSIFSTASWRSFKADEQVFFDRGRALV